MAVCVGDVAYYMHEGKREACQVMLHVSINSVAYTLINAWQRVGPGCDARESSSCFTATNHLELVCTEQLETAVVYNTSHGHVVVLQRKVYIILGFPGS